MTTIWVEAWQVHSRTKALRRINTKMLQQQPDATISTSTAFSSSSSSKNDIQISNRIQQTENPHIEDILDGYAHMPHLINLALGSSYWNPPEHAIAAIQQDIFTRENHRYGNILGMPALRERLMKQVKVASRGQLDVEKLDIAITSGANQAFQNIALTLCDANDNAVILAPYYFSHLLALQLSQAQVTISPFDKNTLKPIWSDLEASFEQLKPKLVS